MRDDHDIDGRNHGRSRSTRLWLAARDECRCAEARHEDSKGSGEEVPASPLLRLAALSRKLPRLSRLGCLRAGSGRRLSATGLWPVRAKLAQTRVELAQSHQPPGQPGERGACSSLAESVHPPLEHAQRGHLVTAGRASGDMVQNSKPLGLIELAVDQRGQPLAEMTHV